MNCIFCKIVAGSAESTKVYEDDRILAFMDIMPVRAGQIGVIPKEHIDHFSDIPDELAHDIYAVTHRLMKAVRKAINPERVGLVVHGYGVAHAHMIIVPQHHENDIVSGRQVSIEDGKVVFTGNLPLVSHVELERVAALIRNQLN
jgi:histidine triad (HIT) family protein